MVSEAEWQSERRNIEGLLDQASSDIGVGVAALVRTQLAFGDAHLADRDRVLKRVRFELVEHIRSQRQPDGTWLQGHRLAGEVWLHQDVPAGEASRWVTLQATRVLDWWDAGEGGRTR